MYCWVKGSFCYLCCYSSTLPPLLLPFYPHLSSLSENFPSCCWSSACELFWTFQETTVVLRSYKKYKFTLQKWTVLAITFTHLKIFHLPISGCRHCQSNICLWEYLSKFSFLEFCRNDLQSYNHFNFIIYFFLSNRSIPSYCTSCM